MLSLTAIGAFFVALVVAYAFILPTAVRQTPVPMPVIFWLSTALLALSSFTFQRARRALRRAHIETYRRYLRITAAIGYVFLAMQLGGAFELSRSGVAFMANPQGNMYFSFSGIHGAHLLGGLIGMHWLLRRAGRLRDGEEQPLRKHRQEARLMSMYWHFMGILWLGLFAFLLGWS